MRQDYIDKRAQTLSGFCETLEESILRHHHKIANFLDDLKRSKSDIAKKILDKQEEIIQNLIQKMTSKEVAKVSNISKSRCHCLFKEKWRCYFLIMLKSLESPMENI